MTNYRNQRNAESVARYWGKSLKNQDWYNIDNKGDDTEIQIYDVIGWPFIDANQFKRDLNGITSNEVTVSINSPGGDIFDGTAIYNDIKNHSAHITTKITGLAASMASIIALAGDDKQISSNGYYMIHNPSTFAWGEAGDFRKVADLLERIGGNLAQTYVDATGGQLDGIQSLMDDETWFMGGEAVEHGFIDSVIETAEVTAKFDLGMFAHSPGDVNAGMRKTPVKNERELERVLTQDAGFTRSQARAVINNGFKNLDATQDAGDINALNNLINRIQSNV